MKNPNITAYRPKTDQYDVDFEQYNSFGRVYGEFTNDGMEYTVFDRNTPRQWINYLVNDHFGSVIANDGSGFSFCEMPKFNVTKYYSQTDYLIRTLNGKRVILLKSKKSGKSYDFFADSEDFTYTVSTGRVKFNGSIEGANFSVTLFVPCEDNCECWIINATAENQASFELTVGQDFITKRKDIESRIEEGKIFAHTEACFLDKIWQELFAVFSFSEAKGNVEAYSEIEGKFKLLKATLCKEITVSSKGICETVIAAAAYAERSEDVYRVLKKYADQQTVELELQKVTEKWKYIRERNSCDIPDKNLQYFLNNWLKNQLYMTSRYNRSDLMGYRDVMQDAWGNILVEPQYCRFKLIEGLSRMYTDGRCPRQYDKTSDYIDARDFMDSPLWAGITLVDYIKETGDYSILEEQIGYYDSDKKDSALEHILLSLEYLYHSRGKNGLILMRHGDWLDGLGGIFKYGEATTVWGTIAAFYVQNLLAELLDKIGDDKSAERMRMRSAEYKEIVNSVGWDGNWYAYAFIDEEPIGSHLCHEGKMYLNPQAWAIFSGIYDDESKVEKMYRSIHIYLSTMYGPMVLAPAYKKFGDKCGRLQNQLPGTFANSAIYLHAASFKAFADGSVGKYDEALDTLQRILPNHTDSCDGRRTSEPYCVGNVYYGPEHPCFGLNLYTWFTATPAWVIHSGFESFLGVKSDFDGLRIKAADVSGWDKYTVTKLYRGTKYVISFERGCDKGIWADGIKIANNLVSSNASVCKVKVVY